MPNPGTNCCGDYDRFIAFVDKGRVALGKGDNEYKISLGWHSADRDVRKWVVPETLPGFQKEWLDRYWNADSGIRPDLVKLMREVSMTKGGELWLVLTCCFACCVVKAFDQGVVKKVNKYLSERCGSLGLPDSSITCVLSRWDKNVHGHQEDMGKQRDPPVGLLLVFDFAKLQRAKAEVALEQLKSAFGAGMGAGMAEMFGKATAALPVEQQQMVQAAMQQHMAQ